jgi:hypothetical protein
LTEAAVLRKSAAFRRTKTKTPTTKGTKEHEGFRLPSWAFVLLVVKRVSRWQQKKPRLILGLFQFQ